MLRIREARARDALELVRLRREVLEEGRWFIATPFEGDLSVERETERILRLGAQPNAGLWIARRERVVLGFLSLVPPPFLRMQHVVKLEIQVARAARGQGVGRALLKHGQAWVRSNPRVSKVGLNVFADNARAIGLYRSLGFVEEGRRTREYFMEDGSWRDDLLFCWFPAG